MSAGDAPRHERSGATRRRVLVGDFLLGQAFKMMVEVGSHRRPRHPVRAAAVIAEGEVLQLGAAKSTATTEDEYMEVIGAKTAALFSAAAEVGPVLAARDRAERAAFRSFGHQSRPGVPADRRCTGLRRQHSRPWQANRQRFPRGQDHAAGDPRLSAWQRGGTRVPAAGAGGWRDRRLAISNRRPP